MNPRTRTVRILCALVLVGGLAAAGCGSDSDQGGGTTTTGKTTPSPSSSTQTTAGASSFATPQELGAVLLTGKDLGSGWTQQQRDVFTTRSPENPSIEDSLSTCPGAAGKAKTLADLGSATGADVELEHARSDVRADLLRQQAWSNARVSSYFTTLKDVVKTCSGTTWKDPDGSEVTVRIIDAPKVGDESITMSATTLTSTPSGDMAWRGHLTVARFGTVLMGVGEVVVQSADAKPPTTSEADWQAIVDVAAAKVAGLHTN